jgi:hypothetical protein
VSRFLFMPKRKSRPKTKPYPQDGQYQIAYLDLLERDGRKRTSSARSEAGSRRVVATGSDRWLVKGGFCDHTVVRQNSRVVCVDHEPAHKRNEGQACCHEIAVYKMLAWKHIPALFTPDGFRRRHIERQAA